MTLQDAIRIQVQKVVPRLVEKNLRLAGLYEPGELDGLFEPVSLEQHLQILDADIEYFSSLEAAKALVFERARVAALVDDAGDDIGWTSESA